MLSYRGNVLTGHTSNQVMFNLNKKMTLLGKRYHLKDVPSGQMCLIGPPLYLETMHALVQGYSITY